MHRGCDRDGRTLFTPVISPFFSGLVFLELIDLRDRGDLRAVAVKIPLGRDVACVGPAHRHDMRSGVKLPDMLKASASTVASVLSDPADVLRRRSSR